MDLFKILDTTPEPQIVQLATNANVSGDYWLPVPMTEYQKELTDQVVSLHYSDILKYFETEDKDQVLLDSLETLYLNSQLVATHPYLLITHYIPKSMTSKDGSSSILETSGKFQVLRDLFALLQDLGQDLRIAIVGRDGKLLDLLESILINTCKTNIKRVTGNYLRNQAKLKQTNHKLTTYLVPSSYDVQQLSERFDLIFSFDITPSKEFLDALRAANPSSPIIRFVTVNSIDHIASYFRNVRHFKRNRQYLVDVTAAIVVLRDRCGVLPPDLRPIYSKKLNYFKNWAASFKTQPWPLPEMAPIRRFDANDVEKSLLTEVVFEKPVKRINSEEFKTFYNLKRLNKDYTTNPLNDINFGILSVNSNYNDALTHKLIQNYNVLLNRLLIQLNEFNNFIEIESQKKDYLVQDETKFLNDLTHLKERIKSGNVISKNLTEKIDKLKLENSDMSQKNKEINRFDKVIKIQQLKEEIAKQQHTNANLTKEVEYVSKEIANANSSIEENVKKIAELKQEIVKNEKLVDEYFQTFTPYDSTKDVEEIQALKNKILDLDLMINENLKILQRKIKNGRNSPSL